ncbi:MAG TPA: DNA-processing protein DprA [Thermodesulfobacteriota bacterium]|nr:DNA-processing protein DprA [Thermodesulfobacteriota bacterium]
MEEWKYWIALRMVNGVGDVLFRNLLAKLHSPKNIFQAKLSELGKVEGIGERTAQTIKEFSDWSKAEEEARKVKKAGFNLVLITDSNYPKNLFNTYNPPPFLYVQGDILPQDCIAVAIVGTRVPDRYGRFVAAKIAEELAERGITIVSGMARGIDSVAHASALKRGGRTIAVLGSGLGVIYPPENKKLYEEISKKGAIVSEFPLGTAPDAVNFPRRNRIISGLSLGVVVVQASDKSGSLITASFALEQNREVFAVPGNIGTKLSRGTNSLIKQGAKLVESVEDIVNEIEALRRLGEGSHIDKRASTLPELSPDEKAIYSVLGSEPIHIDEIIKLSGLDSAKALSALLSLELNGLVAQLPGKIFQLRKF